MRSQPFLSPFVSAPQATLTGDLVAMSSPAGHAKGIVIDNPSGSWLLVFPTYDYVPPYVLGWSRDFPYEVASTTVRYVNGPSGQISTQQGDPFDVVLDTDVVGSSDGSPAPGATFIEQFTPTLAVSSEWDIRTTGDNVTLLPAIAGKRYRILTAMMGYVYNALSLSGNDSGITVQVTDSIDNVGLTLSLAGHDYAVDRYAGAAIDFTIGNSIVMFAQADWADVEIITSLVYQII